MNNSNVFELEGAIMQLCKKIKPNFNEKFRMDAT